MDLVTLVLVVVVTVVVAAAAPHFVRGFREARERRGVDLNMEHAAAQELAEEAADDADWRRRLDRDLEHEVARWSHDTDTDERATRPDDQENP